MPSISIQQVAASLGITVVVFASIYIYLDNNKVAKQPLVEHVATSTLTASPQPNTTKRIIGTSVNNRPIELHTFGNGPTHLLFVGGVHGGYEWNSTELAYKLIDELTANKLAIPTSLTVEIIPTLNPDGLHKVTGTGGRFSQESVSQDKKILASARFNTNDVDLNRNFDCKWKPKSSWRSQPVSAGTAPFSEPEAKALKDHIASSQPAAVVFWHSQANGVFASQCNKGILPETLNIMNTYSKASGYPAIKSFDAYETTGAADDWLASINIPAITVELKSHETIEWDANRNGVRALLESYHSSTAK